MIIDYLLVLTTFICGVIVSIYDIKLGIVPNKYIAAFGIVCMFLRIVSYLLYPTDLGYQVMNIIAISIVSAILYITHVWGGGDCKLLVLIAIGIPMNCFWSETAEYLALLFLIVIIFSIGFLYLLIDTIILFFKKKQTSVSPGIRFRINKKSILGYICFPLLIIMINQIVFIFLPTFYSRNTLLLMMLDAALVWAVGDVSFFTSIPSLIALLIIDALLISKTSFSFSNIYSFVLVIGISLLRRAMSRFNYDIIPVMELKTGMILSQVSVMQFAGSNLKDIPKFSTEDLSSKLTEAECIAINRWYSSHPGITEICIVRKIPFAIFITVGYLFFILIGACL